MSIGLGLHQRRHSAVEASWSFTSSQYLASPTTTVGQTTGEWEAIIDVALDEYVPVGLDLIMSKWGTTVSTRDWGVGFWTGSTGRQSISMGDGSTTVHRPTVAAPPLTNGERYLLRFQNSIVSNQAIFSHKTPGAADWTVFETLAAAGATAVQSTTPILLGSTTAGDETSGTFYSAEFYVDGVLDFTIPGNVADGSVTDPVSGLTFSVVTR